MNSLRHSLMVSVALCLVLVVAFLAYQPGLSGPFFLDDFDNLSALEDGVESWDDVPHYLTIGNAGPLGRPIAKLSFLLDDNNWPSDPRDFKVTNLFFHLLTGVFVFVVLRLIGRYAISSRTADWLALVAATLWLIHPMQVSTVLYIVQRMTQLSSLFVLMGVAAHLLLRKKYSEPTLAHLAVMGISIGLFTGLAMLCKESGVLLPVFIGVVEFTILSHTQQSYWLVWWKRLCLLLPTLSIIGYVAYFPKWIGSYANRDFTLIERLLTQFVVLWDYLVSLFSLRVHQLGLFQDDYTIYSSIWNPKVFIAIVATVILLGFALTMRKRFPVISFGILWFFAGHIIESSAVPLELYFEHRNYLPFVGPIFAFVFLAHRGLRKVLGDLANFEIVVLLAIITITSGITWGYSSEWGDSRRIIPIWAAEHPDSLRAQRTFAQHLASEGFPLAALEVVDDTYEAFPHDLSLPLMSVSYSCAFELPLRYDMKALASQVEQHRWTDGLRPIARNLADFLHKTSCRPLATDIAKVLKGTRAFKGEGTNRSGVASLQVIAGDLLLRSGDANGALEFYVDVDKMIPSVDSATRIAGVYLRAGEYRTAREMLEIAFERDSRNGIPEAKMQEYIKTFDLIDDRIQRTTP